MSVIFNLNVALYLFQEEIHTALIKTMVSTINNDLQVNFASG